MIRIALRLDDPSATSGRALEESILGCMARHRVPATVAVIPFRKMDRGIVALDRESASRVVVAHSSGIIDIARHGCQREPSGEFRGADASELGSLAGELAAPQFRREMRLRGARAAWRSRVPAALGIAGGFVARGLCAGLLP